ncbi:hypothetical protein [Verminephrobacter aporrectodeae]|uniref:hypothetical protein n=1 Tax=Verminephrobacter aporrectodeae TaxID=1110389 RepID=UPI0022441BB8|nr:hypothetical protein [Verminephrobacter aporrectodeae]
MATNERISMTNADPAGSTWKKWDLHVHTPSSIIHNYPGTPDEAWEKFLCDLEALPSEFKVIGINDYIFIDGYERVRQAKLKQGRLTNIDLILPVIELRLDKFAGVVKKDRDGTHSQSDWNRINLHIIFDELDPKLIQQQFLGSLAPCYNLIPDITDFKGRWKGVITRDSLTELGQMIIDKAPLEKKADYAPPLEEGFNNLCVSLDKILEALDRHSLSGKYLIAVGKTEWDNLKWTGQSIAEKSNIINKAHLVFTASANPAAYHTAKRKLTESNVTNTLLDCSDAHALSDSEHKDRIGNCFTWIKADATFEGIPLYVSHKTYINQQLTGADHRVSGSYRPYTNQTLTTLHCQRHRLKADLCITKWPEPGANHFAAATGRLCLHALRSLESVLEQSKDAYDLAPRQTQASIRTSGSVASFRLRELVYSEMGWPGCLVRVRVVIRCATQQPPRRTRRTFR